MDDKPKVAPYGKWESPITAELLSGQSIRFQGLQANNSTRKIYITESRPSEGGRSCIEEHTDGKVRDLLPPQYSAASKVHEYGGAAVTIRPDGKLIFQDARTSGVFLLDQETADIAPIIQAKASFRYADFSINPTAPQWILAVGEDHSTDPIENLVVAINSDTGEVFKVRRGADFYQDPQFSPDGTRICWIEWNHPHMPWRETVLFTADWKAPTIENAIQHTKEGGVESICQPRWGFDGALFFASDRTGYWQLYRLSPGAREPQYIHLEGLEDGDFGSRQGYLGVTTFIALSATKLLATFNKNGTSHLMLVDANTEKHQELPLGLVAIEAEAIRRMSDTEFIIRGSTLTEPDAIYLVDIGDPENKRLIKRSADTQIPRLSISEAQHINFPRTVGEYREGSANAFFIPPKNPNFQGPAGAKPPLIMYMHGGPIAHITPGLALSRQYWTSRGFAYVCVNHAGSTGYGRAYRDELYGSWGILDVNDAVSCVSYLVSEGLIDPKRVGIVGESAGGYAVLQALTTHPDVWAGGVSLYGVSDLKGLITGTHKFESHFVQELVLQKDMTEEEQEQVYKARSARFHADKIKAPLLLLQGDADTVVPEEQTRVMEDVMKKQGRKVKVVIFEGEGHGFRKKESIALAIKMEEEWWEETLLLSAQ
ncbi:putative dipeptidyl peptidase IV [Rhizodiscina lignyota]|uniref:Prolyl endopeptidase n=1 Tax=Rhizodiscina lignyota TaxID=1504668 RepID=A0A9P4I788_9PEZI|nr:putative dipeptidyl peptidase IV [Rhizodiscina lignyota]